MGLFFMYICKAAFDFLQGTTGVVQFFQTAFPSFYGSNDNADNPLFYAANMINNKFIAPCGTSY